MSKDYVCSLDPFHTSVIDMFAVSMCVVKCSAVVVVVVSYLV